MKDDKEINRIPGLNATKSIRIFVVVSCLMLAGTTIMSQSSMLDTRINLTDQTASISELLSQLMMMAITGFTFTTGEQLKNTTG